MFAFGFATAEMAIGVLSLLCAVAAAARAGRLPAGFEVLVPSRGASPRLDGLEELTRSPYTSDSPPESNSSTLVLMADEPPLSESSEDEAQEPRAKIARTAGRSARRSRIQPDHGLHGKRMRKLTCELRPIARRRSCTVGRAPSRLGTAIFYRGGRSRLATPRPSSERCARGR
jgi:hypothetical protein